MSDGRETERLDAAAAFLRDAGVATPQLGIVLGSGLKRFGTRVENAVEVPFADVPEWPTPRVEGHGGALVAGTVGGLRVACLTGRVHAYEGWSAAEATRAVRTLARLGAGAVLLTNAAGGIADGLAPGDLLVIDDHLNLTGTTPLLGAHEAALGPRFPDQSHVWDAELRALLHGVDAELKAGVYAALLGPSYETPAEVRMLRTLGASVVGMSTALEAIALNAMGVRVVGLSMVSNLAAGISPHALDHEEVIETGRQAEQRLLALLGGFCAALAAADKTD